MAAPPHVVALLMCDVANRDVATGKVTLLGIHDTIVVVRFPLMHGAFAVYFKLTGLNGEYRFGVDLLAPDLTTVLVSTTITSAMTVRDPTAFTDLAINFSGIRFEVPGRYAYRLRYNDQIAGQISFSVIRV